MRIAGIASKFAMDPPLSGAGGWARGVLRQQQAASKGTPTPPPWTRSTRSGNRTGAFVWIGLHERAAIECRKWPRSTGCTRSPSKDAAVHAHQRPKVERYDDTLFLVLKTVNYVPHESKPHRILLCLSQKRSIHHEKKL